MSRSPLSRFGRLLSAGLTVVALAGCDLGGRERAGEPRSEREVVLSRQGGDHGGSRICEGAARVVTRAAHRKPGRLTGDVDGNGESDMVYLSVARRGRPGCRAFVAADTGDRVLAAPVREDLASFDLGLPALRSLVAINDHAGVEVVVDVGAGASTQFASVYTVADRKLLPVVVSGESNPALFAYGGSVGHVAAIDCVADGRIVISAAVAGRDRLRLTRRFASARGAVWRPDPGATERTVVTLRGLSDYAEFARAPFGSCAVS